MRSLPAGVFTGGLIEKKGIASASEIKTIIAVMLILVAVLLGPYLIALLVYESIGGEPALSWPEVVLTSDNRVTLKFMRGSGTISAGDWQYGAWSGGAQVVPWTPGPVSIGPGSEIELPACTTAVKNKTLSVGDRVTIKIPGWEFGTTLTTA